MNCTVAITIDVLYGRGKSHGSPPLGKELQQLKTAKIGRISHSKKGAPS